MQVSVVFFGIRFLLFAPKTNITLLIFVFLLYQSLHAVAGIAFGHAKRWEDEAKKEKEAGATAHFHIREKSCPKKYTEILDEDGLYD
jgi:hypothetical protein